MRLLFLSNLYPPYDLGGFEQWCQEVALRLRLRGHAVQVLTSRYGLERGQPSEVGVARGAPGWRSVANGRRTRAAQQ